MPNKMELTMLSHKLLLTFEEQSPLHGDCLGIMSDLDQMRVSVLAGMPHDIQSSTVLHEVIHVIDKLFQLDLTETDVDCLAISMYSLLKENPALRHLLFVPEEPGEVTKETVPFKYYKMEPSRAIVNTDNRTIPYPPKEPKL
jgi:hypothetical protein